MLGGKSGRFSDQNRAEISDGPARDRSVNAMNRLRWLALAVCFVYPALLHGQSAVYYQPHFPPEELKARWEKIYDRIGDRAVALVQGMPKVNGFIFPRQNNEFYYLCGIETPHAHLTLDGKSRKVTLYLPPRDFRDRKSTRL